MLWSNVIDVTRSLLFVLAHWCGGSFGTGILVASAAMRIALLPLTIPATRRRLVRERKLRELAPALSELKRRHADAPEAFIAASQKLHARHGLSVLDTRSMVDSLVTFPPAAALYAAVRRSADGAGGFFWVSNLAKPDRVLAAIAAIISGLTAWVSMSVPGARGVAQMLPVVATTAITFLFLTHLSAALALYSVSNSLVGAVERMIAAKTLESSVR
jgi:membrane protein insertase Oxa1/YidC/SpoIIIJ